MGRRVGGYGGGRTVRVTSPNIKIGMSHREWLKIFDSETKARQAFHGSVTKRARKQKVTVARVRFLEGEE